MSEGSPSSEDASPLDINKSEKVEIENATATTIAPSKAQSAATPFSSLEDTVNSTMQQIQQIESTIIHNEDKKWTWRDDEKRLGFPLTVDEQSFMNEENTQALAVHRNEIKKNWTSYINRNFAKKKPIELNAFHFSHTNKSNSFKKLIRRGVPMYLRGKVWFETSGAYARKQAASSEYYKTMLSIVDYDCELAKEMDLDIPRTFAGHPFFSQQETRAAMKRILLVFSAKNPVVGYSQNLTFNLAFPLLFLSEEDAFWLLTAILEDILPKNFDTNAFLGLRVDLRVLNHLIQEYLPKLHVHFVKYNIDIGTVFTGWLLKLFVGIFPIETCLRVWDCLMFEGSKIMFRVALAFLKLHEAALLQQMDTPAFNTYMNTEKGKMFDPNHLITICGTFRNLQKKHINSLRAKYLKIICKEEGISQP